MRDNTLKYLLVLPAVLVVFATAVWPLAQALRFSFYLGRTDRGGFPQGYVGVENYTWAFLYEPAFWNSVYVTGLYTVVTVALTTLFALGLAMLLAPGGRLRSGVQTLLILPFAMSPALIGVSFRFMFNPEFGLFDAFFGVVFPPLADVSWLADPDLGLRRGGHGRCLGLDPLSDPGADRGGWPRCRRTRSRPRKSTAPADGASSAM